MADDLCLLPAVTIAERVRAGDVSPVDVTRAHLDRIDRRDDDLGAYVTVTRERALAAAEAHTKTVAEGGDPGPLAGVPVGIKDLVDVAGVPTSQGTSLLADEVAESDDPAVARLRDAGAIVLGKTNTPPFARSAVTESDLAGYASTPFGAGYNAGGSSGGSAAAVAAGLATIGYGTDGGGSIRIPASLCGVVGFKPTFGRIPWTARPDAFAHARGNHAGPLTRTVPDAALALDVVAGPDHADPFSLPADGSRPGGHYLDATHTDPDGLSIAYSADLGVFPVADRVEGIVADAAADLADATAATLAHVEVDFGMTLAELVEPKYHRWGPVHTAVLAEHVEREHGIDLTDHPEVVGEEFAQSVADGHETDAVSYKLVNLPHTRIYDALQSVFDEYDLLVTPTLSVAGVENGTIGPTEIDGEAVDPATDWFLTFPFNFGGPPALSVPAGTTDGGLPVGLQIAGQRFDDELVLAAGAALERARPWAHLYETV
ncbi:amidase [Salinirubrum litoreum]|uniref:Amidase n=1 Tax=Salinirubrum litoreum TaxID=1126234 RepID=A0ABD5RGM6_9EURY|nr:amidase [Salinirubrum litoreum]